MALTNAERLLSDAEILSKSGHFSSAKILALYSLEESVKAGLLFECKQENQGVSEQKWNQSIKVHIKKFDKAQEFCQIYDNPIFNEEDWEISLRDMHGEPSNSLKLKNGREGSTYIDFDFDNNRWLSPETHYIFGGDIEADCKEVISAAASCLSAVRTKFTIE